ncbi:fimbrial protein [Providencia sp. Me31A]|uniref:fimbrial protein n=1 Tax=Providencia sp. Me31A TaxID=3392637 RepID=UPI003D2B2E5D
MNMIKRLRNLSYILLLMGGLIPIANGIDLRGQAKFTGSVYSTPCSIYLPNKNQSIDFGLVGASTLSRAHFIKDVFSIQINECDKYLEKGLVKIKFNGPLYNDSVDSFKLGEVGNELKLSILYGDVVISPNKFNTLKPIYFNNSWREPLPKENINFTFILEAKNGSLAELGSYHSYLTFNLYYE